MASGDHNPKKCEPPNPSILIRKLIDLMEHPISKNAKERQLALLKKFLNASYYGFWLHDIALIVRLYETLARQVDKNLEFEEVLGCLLHFSSVPPLMTKVSDAKDYERDFEEYFHTLGYMTLCLKNDLKRMTLVTIKNLTKTKTPIGFGYVSLESRKNVIENSKLPELLAQNLKFIDDDLYSLILEVMYSMCLISPKVCQKFLAEDSLEFLLRRLEPTWRQRKVETKPKNPSSKDSLPNLELTCSILWHLLNSITSTKHDFKSPSLFALWSLQYAFRFCNVCPTQKSNRNNLTAIILKLLLSFEVMDFKKSELCDDIELLATTVTGCRCRSNLRFGDDLEDFHFKKIIWACLHFYRKFQVTKDTTIIKTFLKNLFQEREDVKVDVEQYCELAKIMLRIIPKFLAGSVDVFIYLKAPVKLVKMIESFLTKPFEIELLEGYVHCVQKILMLNDNDLTVIFGSGHTTTVITSLSVKILSGPLTATHQKVLANCFNILQNLCQAGYANNKNIVILCMNFLNRIREPLEQDPPIDQRLTICSIDLLWECILADRSFFREFVRHNGIYILLDVIETSNFQIQTLCLGILVDISRKSMSVPYFITWRKHGKQLYPILLEMFRQQPFQDSGPNKWSRLCCPFQTCSKQLVQVCRDRIHGLIYALKVRFKDRVKIANEHYKLFNEKPSIDDELTMLFAENYMSLQMCKTWVLVSQELELDAIEPVEGDFEQLKEKMLRIKQWRAHVRALVQEILNKEVEQNHFSELQSYTVLKNARLSDALDALKELRYITNCTERMFQMRQKLMLQQEVDATRSKNAYFHRTICALPFTNIYNQSINIQSNIVYNVVEENGVEPVSDDDGDALDERELEHVLTEPEIDCNIHL